MPILIRSVFAAGVRTRPGGGVTMYEAHFCLKRRPFGSTPNGDYYYPATNHERALSSIQAAIFDFEGITVLTGEPGTGKTLLCHRLLERLGPEVQNAFLANSHLPNRTALLQSFLFDLSLPYLGLSEQELRLALTDHLLKTFEAGKRTVLLIDEAQHLDVDLLEELRLLGNLEANHRRALQVILVAQPGLLNTLNRPELAGLQQRVAIRVSVEPLDRHEAADYLVQHIRASGGRPQSIFTDEALEVLAVGTRGIPRLLNQTGNQALLLAQSANLSAVDAEVAMEALSIVGLPPHIGEQTSELSAVNQESEHFIEVDDLTSDPVLHLTDEEDDLPAPPKNKPDGNGKSSQRFIPPRRPA
jgi:type II secretory pathway predicted ATPase ExeA